MYFFYSCLTLIVLVLGLPYFAWQAFRHKKYVANLRQRLGYLPISFNVDAEDSIWLHAVSVGEAKTARALTGALKTLYPSLRLFVSTTTLAGQQVARHEIPDADGVFYFPIDVGFIVRRTLELVRPKLFIVMETEIWPNVLRACRRNGVRTVIANGRISERSYPRYRFIRPLFRHVLDHVDRFCVQSQESADRLVNLGADRTRILVTGNLKFDALSGATGPGQEYVVPRVVRFFKVPDDRPVIIAGSTMAGEEIQVLRAFERARVQAPRALLVIAPRHAERFAEVEQAARDEGFRTVRRTSLVIDEEPVADVVVLDTIGELADLYRLATIVFVGGSLVPTGGHNILEPAQFGKPVLFGPFMHNFKEITEAFLEARGGVQVRDERELDVAFRELLADPARRAALGDAGRTIVDANRGARERTLAVIRELLPPVSPKVHPFRLVK